MRDLFRFVERPRSCSYLPLRTAALEIRAIGAISPPEYAELLARGYRRFGIQVFRPACPECRQCRSLRVLAHQFSPSASERRILRKNEGVRSELHPLYATREHIELYNLYHRFMHEHRGWPFHPITAQEYSESFLSGASHLGSQWLYFQNDRLMGVAAMDRAPGAISLVYFFYDPGWRAQSPGTFSILNQLLYAKSMNLDYAYLGYWIEASQSMGYKGRFRPHELLTEYPPDNIQAVWKRS